jgi:hypothetical protein
MPIRIDSVTAIKNRRNQFRPRRYDDHSCENPRRWFVAELQIPDLRAMLELNARSKGVR